MNTVDFDMDWTSGVFARPVSSSAPAAELVFAGDFCPSEAQARGLRDDPRGFFGALDPLLRNADLSVANLECVFTDRPDRLVKDGPPLVFPAGALDLIDAFAPGLWCMANNHILDAGAGGLLDTCRALDQRGRRRCGAGSFDEAAEAARYQLGGVRLAIVNVAEAEEAAAPEGGHGASAWDAGRTAEQVARLKAEGLCVVVVIHAGREYLPVPPPYIRHGYRALAEAGADLVVGHHPHVPQGIECHRGTPIVYSLGNFVMHTPGSDWRRRLGLAVKARCTPEGVAHLELIPLDVGERQVTPLAGPERAEALRRLASLSVAAADDTLADEIWDAFTDHWVAAQMSDEVATSMALLAGEDALMRALLRLLAENGARSAWSRIGHRVIPFLVKRMRSSQPSPAAGPSRMRGATRARNRFATRAHRELYLHALDRILSQRVGASTDRARALLAWPPAP